MRRRAALRSLLLCPLAAGLLAPAAARAGEHVISVEWAPTPVSRYRAFTAWSGYDRGSREYRLKVAMGTTVKMLAAIAPRSVPFDVDLGPGPDGRVWAVFSRCRTDPAVDPTIPPGLPVWARGRGCRLRWAPVESMFDGRGGKETAVPGTSAAGASEFLPALWGRRVTFARVYDSRRDQPNVYSTMAHKPTKLLPGGPRGDTGLPGPMSIDTIRDGYVSYTWAYQRGRARTWLVSIVHIDPERRVFEQRMDGGGSWRWLLGAWFEGSRTGWARGCVLGTCRHADEGWADVPIAGGHGLFHPSGGIAISAAHGNGRTVIVRAAGYGVAGADNHPRCRTGSDPQFATAPGCQIVIIDG